MRNFIFVAVLCLLAFLPCNAQEINEIPMYGGASSPELTKANEVFVAAIITDLGSKEVGAKSMLKMGWNYISRNDWKMAMKRFNQAWLLTPDNGEVFWGFGAALGLQGKYEESVKYFTKAETLLPDNGRLIGDFALLYLRWANNRAKPKVFLGLDYLYKADYDPKWKTEVAEYLNKGIELSERASRLAPNEEAIYVNWASALYAKGDYAGAWEKVKIAEQLGGTKLDSKFLKALNKKMKRP